ncbi:uncharacterized protein LODBEIA_P14750 [Lodderomyces beijingensis]|uniref:U3 small nucleolar RNA-associated protein 25 n=1 Tax=Lodderomyces beijingensis TaxID=1775926 RepID=A0ABP0ZJE0_9ASCO
MRNGEEEEEDTLEGERETSDEKKGMAYTALLTLLQAEERTKKEPKPDHNLNTNPAAEKEEKDQDELEKEEPAGANLDEPLAEDEAEDQDEQYESDLESDDEDAATGLARDPFDVHFNQPSEEYMEKEEKLVIKEKGKWTVSAKKQYSNDLSLISITQSPPGTPIKVPPSSSSKEDSKLSRFPLKKRVHDAYESVYGNSLTTLESILLEPISNYQDVNYQYRTYSNIAYRKLYVLHALNHIYKTRDRIIKNTLKLHASKESGKDLELRDQGFTRPKVLILLPTRDACNEVVEAIIKLSGTDQQENKKKFTSQFYTKDIARTNKPADFQDAFKGNNNDFFCIGLKLTRKSLKLYSSFYSSDIILASPLGLSMILENPDKKKRQYDFISSIEVLIVDKANQIEMQNWDHVNTVMKYINKVPQEFHDADFSRIRMWNINDQAKLLRQTLVFSEFLTPSINNLVSSKSFNLAGKVRFKPVITSESSIMNSIGLKIKQLFQRSFPTESPADDPEARFKFFTNTIVPNLLKTSAYGDGIMIYIPSYFDYLRVKAFFKTSTKYNFGSIDEYSSQSKLSRTRHEFSTGKIQILLYTERLHFFRRYEINGVKNLIIYSPPSNPIFYKELIRFIGKSVFKEECDLNLVNVKTIFSKWDANALERIVGNERAPVLCNSQNELYEFR